MQIIVNDEALQCDDNMLLAALLDQLSLETTGLALALNQHILPRDQWAQQPLQEGDALLIFQAIAGG
ncbi:sulfur carrier protein ThiS [Enterobacteriaceae bacterium RIT691]|nr:sulfur carrier protein ThiS [Enterobacteriaceae bacterium RIT691]